MKEPHLTPGGTRAVELLNLRRLLESGELTREEYASRLNWTQNDPDPPPRNPAFEALPLRRSLEKGELTRPACANRLSWTQNRAAPLFPAERSRLPGGLEILRRALLAPMIRQGMLAPVEGAQDSPWWAGERLIWPAAPEGEPPVMPRMPCVLELDRPPAAPVKHNREPAGFRALKSGLGVVGGIAFTFAGVSDLAGDHLGTGLGLLLCAGGLFLFVYLSGSAASANEP